MVILEIVTDDSVMPRLDMTYLRSESHIRT